MIKYRKNSLWGFNRQLKKSPHKALLNLEVTAEEAVHFDLRDKAFYFVTLHRFMNRRYFMQSDHRTLSLKDSQEISSFKLLEFKL